VPPPLLALHWVGQTEYIPGIETGLAAFIARSASADAHSHPGGPPCQSPPPGGSPPAVAQAGGQV